MNSIQRIVNGCIAFAGVVFLMVVLDVIDFINWVRAAVSGGVGEDA